MAISLITRTNTIDEWRIQTNQSATTLNNLEAGSFSKSNGAFTISANGSLVITADGTAVQVANNALFQSNVTIGKSVSVGASLAVSSGVTVEAGGLSISAGDIYLPSLNVADTFVYLNYDASGTPTESAGLALNRGSSSDVYLRWNEVNDKWEFTNDGSSFADIAGVYQVLAAGSYANSAFEEANTASTSAATASQRAVTSGSYANSAYTQANTGTQYATSAGSYANSAYVQANTAIQYAQAAGRYANAAFNTANTKYESTGGLISGTVQVAGHLTPSTHNTYNIGNTSYKFATVYATTFSGTATTAQYADLAELYLADKEYPVGTVMMVGGDKEVTAATPMFEKSVIGVVSDKPAYLMNDQLQGGTAIALKGRVPVRVIGQVVKGEPIGVAAEGVGSVNFNNRFGVALENKETEEEGIIEVVIL